jgi:hypothetical protein
METVSEISKQVLLVDPRLGKQLLKAYAVEGWKTFHRSPTSIFSEAVENVEVKPAAQVLSEFVGSRPSNEFVDLLISAWNSIEDLITPAVHATERRNSKDQPEMGLYFFLSNILDMLAKDVPKSQFMKEYYEEAKLISGRYHDCSFTQHFEAKLTARDVLFLSFCACRHHERIQHCFHEDGQKPRRRGF